MQKKNLEARVKDRGQNLKRLRLKSKFTQAQLANQTGLSVQTISKVENGHNYMINVEELILSKIMDREKWIPFSQNIPKKNSTITVLFDDGSEKILNYPFKKIEGLNEIFWK